MAVESGSVSQQGASGKKRMAKSPQIEESKSQECVVHSPGKRNKSPGIRLVGSRIYDSVNGKTCHQCRQKTRDFVAACKSQRNNKPCPIMYCHKCLLNRYGEKAEEAAGLEEWSCPKCRGICNCSVCMKKRGHQPTGMLINTAKATGYSSVSEMLIKGVELLNNEKVVAHTVASPNKDPSLRKRGKENTCDRNVDANLLNDVEKKSNEVKEVHESKTLDNASLKIIRSPDKRKLDQENFGSEHVCSTKLEHKENGSCGPKKNHKKIKRSRLDEMSNTIKNDEDILKGGSPHGDVKKLKKSRKELGKDGIKNEATLERRTSPMMLEIPGKMPKEGEKDNVEVDTEDNVNKRMKVARKGSVGSLENYMKKRDNANATDDAIVLKHQDTDCHADIPLPVGEVVNTVAGIDLQAEDVGNALQFLEFCAVFGKILEVKKGQPEFVLQDIFHGRTGRRGKFSLTVQFHINLLSILLMEQGEESVELSPSNGKTSWFDALKKCLSKSQSVLKAHGLNSFEKKADYETLTASEKLRLLNVLCDEVLGTEKVRNWMDDQNAKLTDKVKEAKQKVLAAKDKEKQLKQKMKDDIAQAIIAKHGAPLSISEHETIVSCIKREVAQAQAEVLESKGICSKKNQTSGAVRIEPTFVGSGGHAYWKLNCYGESAVLHQNIGNGDSLTLDEKWFAIDDEGKEAVEKHIGSLRGKRLRALRRPDSSTLSQYSSVVSNAEEN